MNDSYKTENSHKSNKTKSENWFKKHSGFIVFIIVLLIAIACVIFSLTSSSGNKDSHKNIFDDKEIINVFNKKENNGGVGTFRSEYIAVLKIEGTIEHENKTYDQDWLLSTVSALEDDVLNKGILLFIDSPGGTVYEADELYLALKDFKKNTNRPVWAYFGSMAASGGYYIGCAANYIAANRNTLTGSIGVLYGPAVDLTELFKKYGIKMTTFKAGKNKNMLNYNSPVTEEHAAIMQSIVDEAYDQFTQIVAESRNMSLSEVKQIADGRIYTAKQALENQLIDSICSYDQTLDDMKAACGDDSLDVHVIEKIKKKSFYDFLRDSEMNFKSSANPVEAVFAEKLNSMPDGLLYYCQF